MDPDNDTHVDESSTFTINDFYKLSFDIETMKVSPFLEDVSLMVGHGSIR